MKKLIITAMLLTFGLTVNAQNTKKKTTTSNSTTTTTQTQPDVNQQQVTRESTTRRVTVNDGTVPRTIERTERTETRQDIELKDAESNKLNKDVQPTPVQVQKSTTVSGTGIPTQEVDRSSYYQFNGTNYQFTSDNSGYKITSPGNSNVGVLRKTSNNNYIYRTKDRVSVGHFDESGNFVLETYDDKNDRVMVETYTRVKQ